MPAVIANSANLYCICISHPFFFLSVRPCKVRASNCLPHNEHPFPYFTCVIAPFGWSCHPILLFRWTNMRNVGKSNQDAKIMTCYVHKHALYTVDSSPNKFQVYLNHVWSQRPCRGNIITDIVTDSHFVSFWQMEMDYMSKTYTHGSNKAGALTHKHDNTRAACRPAQKHECVHTRVEIHTHTYKHTHAHTFQCQYV